MKIKDKGIHHETYEPALTKRLLVYVVVYGDFFMQIGKIFGASVTTSLAVLKGDRDEY